MPLEAQRAGDKSDSRYYGVETDFDDDLPALLNFNFAGGFDFILVPLIDPCFRPSLAKMDVAGTSVIPFASSDLIVSPTQWNSHVVDICVDRSVGIKRPKHSGDEGPSMAELSGYNAKRQEFDPEYDNDAEQSLTEMEFNESDTEAERELKLRVLRIYLSRLDERKRRKDFILERNLLEPHPLEKELSTEDREVFQRLKVFKRFQSPEEHENLLKNMIEERKIRRRIEELKESRAAGCRRRAEAELYTEQKRKKEMGLSAQKTVNCQLNKSPIDEWDVTGFPGAELLSEAERRLCCQNRLLPSHYLKMQEIMVKEIFKGSLINRSDAHRLFMVDPSKVDRVYETVIKKLGLRDGVIDAASH